MEDMTVLGTTPATLREHVAGEIRAWLGRRKMSEAELSRRLGHTNQMQLHRRLNGLTPWDVDELGQICEILHIRITDLLPEAPVTAAPPAKPLNLDQLAAMSARLHMPLADLLPERRADTSPWYAHLTQPGTPPNGHPRDNRPLGGPTHAELIRRPQRRSALLPAGHMTVNAGRLAG